MFSCIIQLATGNSFVPLSLWFMSHSIILSGDISPRSKTIESLKCGIIEKPTVEGISGDHLTEL